MLADSNQIQFFFGGGGLRNSFGSFGVACDVPYTSTLEMGLRKHRLPKSCILRTVF